MVTFKESYHFPRLQRVQGGGGGGGATFSMEGGGGPIAYLL